MFLAPKSEKLNPWNHLWDITSSESFKKPNRFLGFLFNNSIKNDLHSDDT